MFLHFCGWGEPFLNKDLFSMIRYAKDKGIKIITSTNGHFFENVDKLLDTGLDVLIFALNGVDKETSGNLPRQPTCGSKSAGAAIRGAL
jgi:MoaA/NifB/PqqE/SkfB family radical SAM enzyme